MFMLNMTYTTDKSPAANERFGSTATLTPWERQCKHERNYPAERAVKAATSLAASVENSVEKDVRT